MKMLFSSALAGLLALSAMSSSVFAQTAQAPDLMIVLDGSGSMWGQINGRTKIEIARETLSSVLSEASLEQNMGMFAYGHRVRGQCSDIELMVPLAPAAQSVPQMIVSANGLNPIGMTPLSDSVRQAADYLRFTEKAATVVLITDGIETCNADPCALGNELARLGLDFTAHVVGFGMSEEEGAQVACLAENTGGQFFLANDPQALTDALSRTLGAPEDFVPEEDVTGEREVHFLLRDVEGADILRGPNVLTLSVSSAEIVDVPDVSVSGTSTGYTYSGAITLPVGTYTLDVSVRSANQAVAYTAAVPFTVEAGDGPHIIDRVLGARLRIVPMISANEPFSRGLPTATFGSPHLDFLLTPVVNGLPVPERAVRIDNLGTSQLGNGIHEAAYGAGTWLVRGTLGRLFAREKLVEIVPGETTEMLFDFEAARLIFDFDDGGVPVRTPTFYPYDEPGQSAWAEARWRDGDGQLLPMFIPVGTWLIRGGDYHNQANRGELIVDVPSAGQTITIRPSSNDTLGSDDLGVFNQPGRTRCIERTGSNNTGPCLIEKVQF